MAEISKPMPHGLFAPLTALRLTMRPKCGAPHLLRLHSGNKSSPSQGLNPQVKRTCVFHQCELYTLEEIHS